MTKLQPDLLLLSLPFSDTQGLHVLPQTADWSSFPPQQYLLTLGFKNKEDGKFLEKVSSRKLPTFTGDWNLHVQILKCPHLKTGTRLGLCHSAQLIAGPGYPKCLLSSHY